MADDKTRIVFDDFRGGRNAVDPPWTLGPTECQDAVDVDFWQTRLGRKRGGAVADAGAAAFFTGKVSWLYRHVPGISEAAAELWAMDDSVPPSIAVMAAGTAFAGITALGGGIGVFAGNAWETSATSINGKLIMTYKSANNRPVVGVAATLRVAGLIAPAVPTVANQGAGAYAAVLRYYRIRWTVQAAGITIRRSEAGPSASFTPSGAGVSARVTRPTAANEAETHWEVEASTDNISFYRIATVVIATTTYDDSAATTTYNLSPLSQLTGTYTLQKPYKFVAADQNRVLGFGSHRSTDKQHRVEYSAVIGSLDTSDEERVDTTVGYYADFDEMDGGEPTGLCGPVYGSFFVFKERQVWQGTPTGNVDKPFEWKKVSPTVGAIAFNAIAKGEDAIGNPAIYWMSRRGPYRWGLHGIEYIGKGVEDYIMGPNSPLNLAATNAKAVVLYYPDKRQVWYWWPTTGFNDPSFGFIYDITTGGWSRIESATGSLAHVRCAAMFANTPGATMSKDLKPYVGQWDGNAKLWKADTGTTDAGTAFQSYVVSRTIEPGGPGYYGEVGDAVLMMVSTNTVSVIVSCIEIFTLMNPFVATATGDATQQLRYQVRCVDTALGQAQMVYYRIGDVGAVDATWSLERLVIPVTQTDAVSG